MPSYIITCRPDASKEEVAAAKKTAVEQGGTIGHEYELLKGFSVSFPDGTVNTLSQHPSIASVDADQVVSTHCAKHSAHRDAAMRCLVRPLRAVQPTATFVSKRHCSRPCLRSPHLRLSLSTAPHHEHAREHQPPPPPPPPPHPISHGKEPPPLRDQDISRLAEEPVHQLRLADLVKHGWPPLSEEALLQSANFSLELIPIRLARRLQALRSLPYIVVSNPHVRQIYGNYRHSLRSLLPLWRRRAEGAVATLDDEIAFTESLADLVATHQNTIPFLAQGFLECRKYISPAHVTAFLDEHLRARIGTRLIAEQHIALHLSSRPFERKSDTGPSPAASSLDSAPTGQPPPSYIGIIDTQLRPAQTIDSCAGFVADICELNYGVRPEWRIDGEPGTTFAYVPMHLEYIVTELLKNAFRAVVEGNMSREPIVITIAPEPPNRLRPERPLGPDNDGIIGDGNSPAAILPLDENAPGVTIRIRDRGGGISPEVLPNIWSYSFTTFSDAAQASTDDGGFGSDGLDIISSANNGGSSIAGLGYGLPLSRAYAEFFGGGIDVQSLYGWGTDVYLRLKGVGSIGDSNK
ncbi:mitochondrial pyruvate dehydrogenase [Grosmannia clavigera kw1407]|uniref:Protein-serine/threonine kinase n=1 Tax=Grosmannia clavigera (strain kw1407 / UAMH 11150) TaxID=655863 RepID=F0XFD8_GROCL|nr:mitochondrial pyruvate dehydrogenase [Grosmannia clavigera kw1407]EFX03527.1 mitochondrial pyruvate dehydrogenase [Grosmannia clavigera kw1407]